MSVEECSWMYQGWKDNGYHSQEWVPNTNAFLDRAFSGVPNSKKFGVVCPFSDCGNRVRRRRAVMGMRLIFCLYSKALDWCKGKDSCKCFDCSNEEKSSWFDWIWRQGCGGIDMETLPGSNGHSWEIHSWCGIWRFLGNSLFPYRSCFCSSVQIPLYSNMYI